MADIKEIKALKEELLKMKQEREFNDSLRGKAEKHVIALKERRHLKGHFGKVYALSWFHDGTHIASIAQDGKAILWDAQSGPQGKKIRVVSLRTSWIMDVSVSPSGALMASGGLDNLCTIHNIGGPVPSDNDKPDIRTELNGHEGFLSTCTFVDEENVVTSGGDGTVRLWKVSAPDDHDVISNDSKSEVMSVDVSPDRSLLATGNTDSYVRLYDYRASLGKEVFSFVGHESDVNSVKFFPDSRAIASCSDDATVRLFDMRSKSQLNIFQNERILCAANKVDFSQSGTFIFASYDDFNARAWDTVSGDCLQLLEGHTDRVSSVKLSPSGQALCTASWDQTLKVWA
eukprot:TRINITY_DN2081_c0_g2_i1.p1 TRINITY_DN2081_c0_g2~~TRINITY_DN2081_c0_g2_i1.p1  ORF type:complete len:344 (-),score=82.09 TRINITY_DN2081_c0_g2_i1:802-1833(-)